MRSRIISICLAAVSAILLPQLAQAQIAASNPLEWVALAEGNELINSQIDKQIKGQTQTAVLQNSIAAEFNRIHQWEKEYNSYLKTASGYASSLKACTHLYNDGVRIFLTLGKLGKAIKDNPQGIIAGMSMNNLYIEKGEHADRRGTEPDPVGFERQAVLFQPETAPALPEHTVLYAERCMEQCDGRHDRPQQRRSGTAGPYPVAACCRPRTLKKGGA